MRHPINAHNLRHMPFKVGQVVSARHLEALRNTAVQLGRSGGNSQEISVSENGLGGLTTTFNSGIETGMGAGVVVLAHNSEAAFDFAPGVPGVVTGQIYAETDPSLRGPICLSMRKILAEDSGQPFVVTIDAITRGQVGRVVLMGGCLAYVKGTGATAGIVGSGSVVALDTGGSGANVLWQGTPAGGISLSLIVIGSSGGGGLGISVETTFPAIPTVPTLIWLGGQVWSAGSGSSTWEPTSNLTSSTGVPGT